MPKLWNETIEAHRRDVRDAVLDSAAALANERGVLGVTMSEVAQQAGIGRATLYKYFSDVESILVAWHERQVARHLAELTRVRDQSGAAPARLAAVLEAFALITHEHRDNEIGALGHRSDHVVHAMGHLVSLVSDLIAEGVTAGAYRADVGTDELALYCLHAIDAAKELSSKAAVKRLVGVTLSGLADPT